MVLDIEGFINSYAPTRRKWRPTLASVSGHNLTVDKYCILEVRDEVSCMHQTQNDDLLTYVWRSELAHEYYNCDY